MRLKQTNVPRLSAPLHHWTPHPTSNQPPLERCSIAVRSVPREGTVCTIRNSPQRKHGSIASNLKFVLAENISGFECACARVSVRSPGEEPENASKGSEADDGSVLHHV